MSDDSSFVRWKSGYLSGNNTVPFTRAVYAVFTYLIAGLGLTSGLALAQTIQVEKIQTVPVLRPLSMNVGGRVIAESNDGGPLNYGYQWPGTYFEAAFEGKEIYCDIGDNQEILHVKVDDLPGTKLIKPA